MGRTRCRQDPQAGQAQCHGHGAAEREALSDPQHSEREGCQQDEKCKRLEDFCSEAIHGRLYARGSVNLETTGKAGLKETDLAHNRTVIFLADLQMVYVRKCYKVGAADETPTHSGSRLAADTRA